jgi:hypothetical protein
MFHTLHRLGLAEVVTAQEGETDWLDRLAEGVAATAPEPSWEGGEPAADEPVEQVEAEPDPEAELEPEPVAVASKPERVPADLKGVAAPASTTLTDGVYDEIRRLRSRVGDK